MVTLNLKGLEAKSIEELHINHDNQFHFHDYPSVSSGILKIKVSEGLKPMQIGDKLEIVIVIGLTGRVGSFMPPFQNVSGGLEFGDR